MAILNITEKATGKSVIVPVTKREVKLAREFPYWQAFFFKIGCGIPQDCISEKRLKEAKEGEYAVG